MKKYTSYVSVGFLSAGLGMGLVFLDMVFFSTAEASLAQRLRQQAQQKVEKLEKELPIKETKTIPEGVDLINKLLKDFGIRGTTGTLAADLSNFPTIKTALVNAAKKQAAGLKLFDQTRAHAASQGKVQALDETGSNLAAVRGEIAFLDNYTTGPFGQIATDANTTLQNIKIFLNFSGTDVPIPAFDGKKNTYKTIDSNSKVWIRWLSFLEDKGLRANWRVGLNGDYAKRSTTTLNELVKGLRDALLEIKGKAGEIATTAINTHTGATPAIANNADDITLDEIVKAANTAAGIRVISK